MDEIGTWCTIRLIERDLMRSTSCRLLSDGKSFPTSGTFGRCCYCERAEKKEIYEFENHFGDLKVLCIELVINPK
jgi:hypothetical protein